MIETYEEFHEKQKAVAIEFYGEGKEDSSATMILERMGLAPTVFTDWASNEQHEMAHLALDGMSSFRYGFWDMLLRAVTVGVMLEREVQNARKGTD